jgi:uncharacterized protein YdhG (YjbR/CyaY superfamily)
MVQSKAKTVGEYLQELPPERREVVAAVRKMVQRHLPKGYVESMAYGMIGYGIPLSRYPDTYNGQPLGYVALAAQKNYYTLYLMSVYSDSAEERELRAAFAKAGKKLDMGKCCVRFKHLADLEMEALGKAIASTPVDRFIEIYEASRRR